MLLTALIVHSSITDYFNYSNSVDYRGIALSSTVGKIYFVVTTVCSLDELTVWLQSPTFDLLYVLHESQRDSPTLSS
jgi:hypothetical protein